MEEFDPLLVTLQVTDVLESLGAPYLIGGSIASILHGMIRTTNDADLISELQMDQVEGFSRALGDSFYVESDSIREAIRRRAYFNVIHLETMFKVDVYLSRRRAFDLARFQRRSAVVLAKNPERKAYVSSPEDTLLAKLDW